MPTCQMGGESSIFETEDIHARTFGGGRGRDFIRLRQVIKRGEIARVAAIVAKRMATSSRGIHTFSLTRLRRKFGEENDVAMLPGKAIYSKKMPGDYAWKFPGGVAGWIAARGVVSPRLWGTKVLSGSWLQLEVRAVPDWEEPYLQVVVSSREYY